MATWHSSSPGTEAAPVLEAPYEGELGRTRTEAVHVPLPDGRVRTVHVHVAVDVRSDPGLREAALAGALHRFEGGEELAIPFLYHDPVARKLALVVPPALRHRALLERARLMTRIAEDSSTEVPDYVREAFVAIGSEELAAYLARPGASELDARHAEVASKTADAEAREASVLAREGVLAERESAIGSHESQLSQREQRLRERAENVTRREDELARIAEEQEAGTRDLAMREAELEQRLESLVQREQALAEREEQLAHRERGIVAREAALVTASVPGAKRGGAHLSSRPPPPLRPPSVRAPSPVAALVEDDAISDEEILDAAISDDEIASAAGSADAVSDEEGALDAAELVDDEVEELEEIEPIGTTPRGLVDDVEMLGDEAVEDAEMVDPDDVSPLISDAGIETRDDASAMDAAEELGDDVEEIEPDAAEDDEDDDAGPPTMIAQARDILGAPRTHADEPAPDAPATREQLEAPPELEGATEMVAVAADGVELFVRLDDAGAYAGELDLLVQLAIVDGVPVVVLALVDLASERPRARRAAIDPRASRDRLVLETLRRRFEARVVFFDHERRFLRATQVASPRELNTARILDRVSRLRASAAIDASAAMLRALGDPPPIRAEHPFGPEAPEAGSARAVEVRAQVDELASWAAPEKMEQALTVLSVPRDAVDAAMARMLERAVSHGLALPSALSDHAVRAGVDTDPATLVTRQIAAFRATVAKADRGGLDDEAIATNWEKLLAAAAEDEVALDSETHELAWSAIRAFRGGATEGDVDPAKLAELAPPQLLLLLEHPRHRRAAAIALCERADPASAEAICKAARKMPRADVVRVVPRVTRLGEEAGDALIDGLSARKTFVRQAFALALGHLKLRRAVVPLLHVMLSEPSDVWREHARVLGHFGTASVRSLTQKLSDGKAPDERLAWSLAHLANHGCQKQVDNLLKSKDRRAVSIAERALAEREAAKRHDGKIEGRIAIEPGEGAIAFTRRFVEELEGTAPDIDLSDDTEVT